HVAEHGQHAGELARLADPTSSGSPERPGGLDQRSLCDERVGGGRLAGSSALGAHRRYRQSAQAEDGPPGCQAPGAQALGDGAGPVAGGLVSTPAHSRAAAAGSAALLGGGAADAGQEPGAQSAADVGTAWDQPLHRLGSDLAEATEAVRSHARERGAAPGVRPALPPAAATQVAQGGQDGGGNPGKKRPDFHIPTATTAANH